LNVVESPELRKIFMMLHQELKDSDIPHQATIQQCIKEIWEEHLKGLEDELKVRSSTLLMHENIKWHSRIVWERFL